MAVLAANVSIGTIGNDPVKIAVPATKADIFYAGAVAWYDRTAAGTAKGLIVDPAAGDEIAGLVCYKQEATAAGDLIEIYIHGCFEFPAIANIDETDQGDTLIFDASGTLSDNIGDALELRGATPAASDCVLGRIVAVRDGKPWVFITPGLTGLVYDATAAAWV